MFYQWLLTWTLEKNSNVLMVFMTQPITVREAEKLCTLVQKIGGHDVLMEPVLPEKFRRGSLYQ